jgi:hypothetical protein
MATGHWSLANVVIARTTLSVPADRRIQKPRDPLKARSLHTGRSVRPLLLLLLVLPASAAQSSATYSVPPSPQPLHNIAASPRAAWIRFQSFEFQEPHLYHLRVHYGPIEGAPSAGGRYGVEAGIEGDEAIAYATVEVLDEAGATIQQVPMAAEAMGSAYRFVGLMTVPSHPFRVRLTGQGVDGTEFTRMHPRLFNPVHKPQTPPNFGADIPPDVPREVIVGFQQMFEELAPKTIADREALLAANPSGRISSPQYRVSNATYEPLLSPAGGPIGIRVTCEIVFPQSGRYSPGVGIRGENLTRGDGVVDRDRLHTLKSTIVPRPREVHAPEQEAQDYPGLFQQRTDFLYEKGTVYRFTVDRVPKYISLDKDGVTLCMSQYERLSHKNFDRMIASMGPTRYDVAIGTSFEAWIEHFYGEGVFYRTFMAEGTPDCDERPRQ